MPTRFAVHVQPAATHPRVGGLRAGSLLVRVRERATDGQANEAVVLAIAQAFGVRPRQVRLVHGRTSRRKLLEVDVEPDVGAERLTQLRSLVL